MRILITGGAGFFGAVLQKYLSDKNVECVVFDIIKNVFVSKNTTSVQGDIRDINDVASCFKKYGPFDAVLHLAAQLAHNVDSKKKLWDSNVNGTKNIVNVCKMFHATKIIFTSSNCLWGKPFHRLITEDDKPYPVEIYGESKLESEKILLNNSDEICSIIIRCPTIISAGRLGLLSILFEFIDEGKKVYLVGSGKNRYQFIYAYDLACACWKALSLNKTAIYNIGSDNVKTFREIYQYVIKKSNSKSKLVSIPKKPSIFFMKLFNTLGLSPLGPYQYKMIAEDFIFDTSKIKNELNWHPTKTNEEMLWESYEYYKNNKHKIGKTSSVSAHQQKAKMGIIKLLKFLS